MAGNEGVAQVERIGSNVTSLTIGDWVIPSQPGMGTWRTHAIAKEQDLQLVPKNISPEYAATIAVNPSAAFRMLEDFVKLEAGSF